MQERFLKKVALLGDGAVGKTSLIRRFVSDQFDDKYIVTVGAKVVKRDTVIQRDGRDVRVTLMIWDILGQRMHDSLHAAYYQGGSGALIVCDLTRRETFEHIPAWIDAFRKVAPEACLVLLGNKSDLPGWAVKEEDLGRMGEHYGAPTYLTSAKVGSNVEAAFKKIAELMC